MSNRKNHDEIQDEILKNGQLAMQADPKNELPHDEAWHRGFLTGAVHALMWSDPTKLPFDPPSAIYLNRKR